PPGARRGRRRGPVPLFGRRGVHERDQPGPRRRLDRPLSALLVPDGVRARTGVGGGRAMVERTRAVSTPTPTMANTPPSGHVHAMSLNRAKAYDDAIPSPTPTAA